MKKDVTNLVRTCAKSATPAEISTQIQLFSSIMELEEGKAGAAERRFAGEMLGVYAIELGMRSAKPAAIATGTGTGSPTKPGK